MAGIVERLTEGIVNRDMQAEGHALLEKWERTGLLEGMESSRTRQSMARLLENQAKNYFAKHRLCKVVMLRASQLSHSPLSVVFSLA